MPKPPRSFLYLALLGAILLTIAIVVRSGMLARKDNPRDRPINSAMREAMEESGRPQLSTQDAMLIAERFSTARTTDSGLLYIEKQRGTKAAVQLKTEIMRQWQE